VREAAAAVPHEWGIGVPANGGSCALVRAPIIASPGGNHKGENKTMTRLRTLSIQLVLFGTLLLASGFGGKGWKW
jgi:hypothetical protein